MRKICTILAIVFCHTLMAQDNQGQIDADIKSMLEKKQNQIGSPIFLFDYNQKLVTDKQVNLKENNFKQGTLFIFINNCEVNPELGRYIENIADSARANQVNVYIVIANAKGLNNSGIIKKFAEKLHDQLKGHIPIILDELSALTFAFGVNDIPQFFYLDNNWVVQNKGAYFYKDEAGKFQFNQNIAFSSYKKAAQALPATYPCKVIY